MSLPDKEIAERRHMELLAATLGAGMLADAQNNITHFELPGRAVEVAMGIQEEVRLRAEQAGSLAGRVGRDGDL